MRSRDPKYFKDPDKYFKREPHFERDPQEFLKPEVFTEVLDNIRLNGHQFAAEEREYNRFKNLLNSDQLAALPRFDWRDQGLDVGAVMQALDLLVINSSAEPFGLVAVEAMACGTPVVASNRGSLPEIVGDAGRLFDPYDAIAMALAISEVLRDDRLRREMREAGLARAQQFMWAKAAKDTLAIFNELTSE